jgi:hypothetical protein
MSGGFYSFAWGSKFRFLIEELGGGGSALYIFILADFWTKVGLNSRLELPVFEQISLLFVANLLHFH